MVLWELMQTCFIKQFYYDFWCLQIAFAGSTFNFDVSIWFETTLKQLYYKLFGYQLFVLDNFTKKNDTNKLSKTTILLNSLPNSCLQKFY